MPQLPWYDSLDPRLTERLLRPSVQPGVIDRRLMNQIFARSQWFNSRLSLLDHLSRRQGGEGFLTDPVPIVYAQPVLQPAGTTSATPLQTNERTVVQAKFIDSSSSSGLNSSPTEPVPKGSLQPLNKGTLEVPPLLRGVRGDQGFKLQLHQSGSITNFTPVVNSTSIVNSTPIVNSTSALSPTPTVHSSSVFPESTSDGKDLDVSQPALKTPPLAPPRFGEGKKSDLAIAAAPMPIIQVQAPEFVVTRHSDQPPDRATRQRVSRIPPLPPLQRLPNPIETTAATETTLPAETTASVQIQRQVDREAAISQPTQIPQKVSDPVPLVYAQPVPGERNPSPSAQTQPERVIPVRRITMTPRSQSSSGQISLRSPTPLIRPGVESSPATTDALPVVQPSVVQFAEPRDRPMVYSSPPASSSASDWGTADSFPANRAITASSLTPNSTQANPFEPGQEFNPQPSKHYQQPLTAQPSVTDQPPAIDLNALTEKIQRKLLRQLTVESERRGHSSWR